MVENRAGGVRMAQPVPSIPEIDVSIESQSPSISLHVLGAAVFEGVGW